MTHSFKSIFKGSPQLAQIQARTRQISQVQRLYEQVAPVSLLQASQVANLEGQTLILAANNSAIAAKLRQMTPELTQQLRQLGCEVTGIQVVVQVIQPPSRTAPTPHTIGPEGKKQLNELAENLNDSPLKTALKRLLGK